MYYKPEEWDPLADVAIEWARAKGYEVLLQDICESMVTAWTAKLCGALGIEYDGDDLNNLATMTCEFWNDRAFGVYNALLMLAGDAEVWHAIYDWGHYSVFY